MHSIKDILAPHRIIPVATIQDAEDIVPLIKALMAGNIYCLEITLRTAAAMSAIKLARQQFPDFCLAAGTVLTVDQMLQLQALDIDFVVSPGSTNELIAAAQHLELPLLPGVMTPSEVMRLAEHGLACAKLFPAQLAGGINTLKQYHNLFPQMQFCPTGGIDASNVMDYSALENVIAVGGSWLTPSNFIQQRDWNSITQRAQHASAL